MLSELKKYDFDQSLGKITQQVSKLLGQRLEEKFMQNNFSITAEQWSILSMLSRRDGPTQKDIGTYLIMDKVSVNRTLDQLEKAGWVARVVSQQDRRSKIVTLTRDGKKLYQVLVKDAELVLQQALQYISEEESQHLFSLLDKVYSNLK